MDKCQFCNSTNIRGGKDTMGGIEVYEIYCFDCGKSTTEWGGMALWKAYAMSRSMDDFEALVKSWKKEPKTVVLKMSATLVEQDKSTVPPIYYNHIFWILTSTKNLSELDVLQKQLLLYLKEADFVNDIPLEQLGNISNQYFLDCTVFQVNALHALENEKAQPQHYLALSKDTIMVITNPEISKELT